MKQYQSESVNELFSALVKAQAAIKPAEKDAANPYYKSKYSKLETVVEACREALTKNGLAVSQITDIEGEHVTLITQLCHTSGQWLRGYYPINPVKNDPQAYGSAVTYAKRYALAAMVGVVSADEDDDGNTAYGIKKESLPELSDAHIAKHKEKWIEAIKKSNDPDKLIAMISTKYMVSDKQKETIRSWAQ